MIYTIPHVILSARCLIPAIMLMGSTTSYWLGLTIIRLVTLPFGEKYYQLGDQRLLSSMISMFGFFFENWSGVEYCFYGDSLPLEPESVLYISNHRCTVDWVIAEVLCLKQNGCGGRVNYLLKRPLLWIPLYGSYLSTRNNVFLRRNDSKNIELLKRKLYCLQGSNMPVWLVIFPEGTRFDRSKLARSRRYAEMAGISKLDHVLAPHTTGFETILNVNRDIFQAVYDVTIIYEGKDGLVMAPDMFGFYSGSCRKVHICLNRIDIKDVPYTNEEQRQWLYRTFQFKDKIINEFRLNGNMNAHYKRHLPLPLSYTMPYTVVYGVLLALMSTTKYGRICWITTFITYSLLGYIFIKCKT